MQEIKAGDIVEGTMAFREGKHRCRFRGTAEIVSDRFVSIQSDVGYFSVRRNTITKVKTPEPTEENENQASQVQG